MLGKDIIIMTNAWRDIIINLIAAIIFFCLGIIISKIPRSIKRHRFKRFFGSPIFGRQVKLVYGVYSSLPARKQKSSLPPPRIQKVFLDGQTFRLRGPDRVVTPALIRAYSYVVQEIGRFRNIPLLICTDDEALRDLQFTFISIGGPLTNELTHLIINEQTSRYFVFENLDDPIKENWSFRILIDMKARNSFQQKDGKDYGFILKTTNSRFPENYFFVCAGLGSRGTSGAAWYLSSHWTELYKEFKSDEFLIVLEVKEGSDTSAMRVAHFRPSQDY